MGFPRMVLVGAAVLVLDLAALGLLVTEAPQGAVLVFHLSTLIGAMGGMEALSWMARSSPWALPAAADQPEEPGFRGRMAAVPWADRAWLRSAILRLLSGGSLAFALLTLIFMFPPDRLHPAAVIPFLLLLLQFVRLSAPGVSAVVLAPLVLAAAEEPATPRDRFHAALAAGLSLVALGLLYVKAGSPPPVEFLGRMALVALNPAFHAYGLLIGGIVWWKAAWISRWMGRS